MVFCNYSTANIGKKTSRSRKGKKRHSIKNQRKLSAASHATIKNVPKVLQA
jgi:hypothetical protein